LNFISHLKKHRQSLKRAKILKIFPAAIWPFYFALAFGLVLECIHILNVYDEIHFKMIIV